MVKETDAFSMVHIPPSSFCFSWVEIVGSNLFGSGPGWLNFFGPGPGRLNFFGPGPDRLNFFGPGPGPDRLNFFGPGPGPGRLNFFGPGPGRLNFFGPGPDRSGSGPYPTISTRGWCDQYEIFKTFSEVTLKFKVWLIGFLLITLPTTTTESERDGAYALISFSFLNLFLRFIFLDNSW
jgi:hypothetical protein